MKVVVLFGASGFVGRALVERVRGHAGFELRPLSSQLLRQSDFEPLVEALRGARPDVIIQGSGLTHHRDFEFHQLYEGNLMPTVRLAGALDRLGRRQIPTYLLGSAAEIGRSNGAVDEAHPARPHTDYGRSKLMQTQFALAKNEEGYRFAVLRLFNVTGIGMNPRQVPRCFLDAVVRGDRVLRTGALDYERDFVDVAAVASTLTTLIERDWCAGLLHICSGVGTTARTLLNEIFRQTGCSPAVEERLAPAAGDYHSVGQPRLLQSVLGHGLMWSPEECVRTLLSAS